MPKIIVIAHLLLVIVENVVTFFGTRCIKHTGFKINFLGMPI